MTRPLSVALLLILLLTACQPAVTAPPSTPTLVVPTPTIVPTPIPPTLAPTPTSLLPTSTPAQLPNSQYNLRARLNYNRHTVAVEQTILYIYPNDDPAADLVLQVEANNQPGVFRLNALAINDQVVASPKLVGNHLDISLPAPLTRGQNLRITLTYDLALPVIPPPSNDSRSVIFGYSTRQTNLIDWYPYVPPRREGKWLVHNPWHYGEHQVYDIADFQVEIELIEPPTNLVLAACAPAQQSGSRYTYTHRNARNFTLSASNMYTVASQKVGEVTITSYAFPFDAGGGRQALKDAVDALTLYSQLFGPYPRDTLAVVEADFHDGMEYDGLYFLSRAFYSLYDGTPKGYLTAIGVHEAAHQWWYALIGNDQALEPWLDESLSTYSELLFYQAVYPDLVKWWWSTRVDYFNPKGSINQRIYDFSGANPYRDAVYLNGAHFLDSLRQKLGDETFFKAVKSYATTNARRLVTSQEFFSAFSRVTPLDIRPIVKLFFK